MTDRLTGTKFAIVPEWVLRNRQLSDGAVRCYGLLARYVNAEGAAWPGQDTLAEALGVTVRSVQRYLSELEDVGALVRVRRGGTSNLYHLRVADRTTQMSASPELTRQDCRIEGDTDVALTIPMNEKHLASNASRVRDEVWDALIQACQIEEEGLTASARGALNRAVRELRAVGAEPSEIHKRAARFARTWQVKLTPSALARRWSELAGPAPQSTSLHSCDLCVSGWIETEKGLTRCPNL